MLRNSVIRLRFLIFLEINKDFFFLKTLPL